MRVDGLPSALACKVPAQEGMVCERQNAPLGLVNADVFRAADFLFPEGLDHHHLLTGSRVLGRVALEVARRLAGLGELPSKVRAPVAAEVRSVPLAVIGAGPAGLSAALAAAQSGARVLLIERERRPGGAALLKVDPGLPDPDRIAEMARAFTGELLAGSECIGLYSNDSAQPGDALVAVRHAGRLVLIVAERVIVATGGVSQPLLFPGVDRPGVYAARGLLTLHEECNFRVGDKLALTGEGAELTNCAAALKRAGYEVILLDEQPKRALGNPVRAVQLSKGRIRCDALAIALPPAPLHELASSVGAQARWSGAQHGFPIEVDPDGRTAVPWLFAAGRVAGRGGAGAVSSGEAAGKAAAR